MNNISGNMQAQGLGLGLALGLAAMAMIVAGSGWLGPAFGALTIAMLFGLVLGNCKRCTPWLAQGAAGLDTAKQKLLRLGIVLYGLRLTLQQLADVGVAAVLTDALVLIGTFALAWWLGQRYFGLDRDAAVLIGAGSAICGAAAVMATAPVLKARADRQAVAVACVVFFGSLAMFLYPWLFRVATAHGVALNPATFGMYTGATIHEVAHVVVAGGMLGQQGADAALMTKMIRVMMLAPFLLVLAFWLGRQQEAGKQETDNRAGRITVPWFAFGFLAVVALNSVLAIPAGVREALLWLDNLLLAMAMAALGAGTRISMLKEAGLRPLGLAATLFLFLVVGGYGIQQGVLWVLAA